MEFAAFADRAEELETEPADLETVTLGADLFADAGEDLGTLARFVQGRVFPAHESTKLDVGPATCDAAIARAAGPNVTADDVEERLAEAGEIGVVAASYDFGGQRGLGAFAGGGHDALAVADVDAKLRAIAAAAGEGSESATEDALFGLLNRAAPAEANYLARLVLGEMRIGVGEGSVRDAVAEVFDVPTDPVERALQMTNAYGLVAGNARDAGEDGLADHRLEVGRPVQAMLAQAGTVSDVLDSWDEVAVETKYDGARVQVHYDGGGDGNARDDVGGDENAREEAGGDGNARDDAGGVENSGDRVAGPEIGGRDAGAGIGVYSRNMEDVTDALPEVVAFVEATVDVPVSSTVRSSRSTTTGPRSPSGRCSRGSAGSTTSRGCARRYGSN
jgi:DNA ligase-1